MRLEHLRDELDKLDQSIVDLLRQRANIATEIGTVKREEALPYYAPERERQILEDIARLNLGDFPLASAQAIFREIMAACLSVQLPLRIAFLGPAGTFTEIAARAMFGQAAQYLPQADFRAAFDAVCGRVSDYAVVPVENSTAGAIREVLDLLADARLTIINESYHDVHHCLLSRARELSEIKVVYSKDTALEQCRNWLRGNLPQAELVPMASTAEGARQAARTDHGAAIAPEVASEVYGLPLLALNIEDRGDNCTRFFALGREMPKPSGLDKTSLLMAVPHKPGALVAALEVFRAYRLNMTLIESRPSAKATFEYVFFIDIEGHSQEDLVARALADLRTVCVWVQVLGSYPRAIGQHAAI